MSDSLFDYLDPARAYYPGAWAALRPVYDGLMALRQEGGLAGLELVPDLAAGLPELSADRKTYTFVLRSGIRYSDGTEVVPDDVRRGLERLFTVMADGTNHPPYFANLLGAGECMRLPDELQPGKRYRDRPPDQHDPYPPDQPRP